MELFPDAKAPRNPNFNPPDEFQQKKGSWLRNLKRMNDSAIAWADFTYQSRAQALQGVDEIIEDVVRMLEAKGIIDNTYSKFTQVQMLCNDKLAFYRHRFTSYMYNVTSNISQSCTQRTTAITSGRTELQPGKHSSTLRIRTFPLLFVALVYPRV